MLLTATVTSGFRLMYPEEIVVLLFSLILYACLFLCGRAVCASTFPKSIWAPTGLLIVYVIFLIGSNIWDHFSILFPLISLVGLAFMGIITDKKTLKTDLRQFLLSTLFVFPLCWLATINNNPFWDDFTNWLPPARYLFEYGHLPTFDNPDLARSTQNYPFARALFHSWVSTITSSFSLNVQGILNILFAGSFLLWADDLVKFSKPRQQVYRSPALFFAFMGLLGGLLIIWVLTLNTRMIITSYADPTFSIFLANIFVYLSITYLKNKDFSDSKFDPALMALLALPVIIKDTGLIFSALLSSSFFLMSLPFLNSNPANNVKKYLQSAFIQFLHFLPAILITFIWSAYCSKHSLIAPLSIQELDDWNFSIIPMTLSAIWGQLLGRPYLLFGFFIVLWLVFKNREKQYQLKKNELFIRAATLFAITVILFHFFCYIAVFSESEAARAASFSRYIAPSGFIIWISIMMFYTASLRSHNYKKKIWIGSVAALIFVSTTIFYADKIVVAGTQAPLKEAAKIIEKKFSGSGSILIIDFLTSGIDSVSIKFYLSPDVSVRTSYMAWKPNGVAEKALEKMIDSYDNIYVHSAGQAERTIIAKILNEKSKTE